MVWLYCHLSLFKVVTTLQFRLQTYLSGCLRKIHSVLTCSVFKFPRGGKGNTLVENDREMQKIFYGTERNNFDTDFW